MTDPNIMGSLADQSSYDPGTGMPYPGNAPDYGDLSQRMTNAQQRLAAGIYEAGAMPGRAFGTVPGGPPTPEEEANWGAGTALGMLGAARLPGGAPAGAAGAGGAKLVQPGGNVLAFPTDKMRPLAGAPTPEQFTAQLTQRLYEDMAARYGKDRADAWLAKQTPAGAVGASGPELVQPDQGIFAYHSSPHDFEKFDLSRIGTGEGAQVYGHGIYAAENPAVSGQGGQYWGQFLNRFSPEEQGAAKALQGTNFNRGEVLATLQNSINEISNHLKYFKSSDPLMYEADVGYHNKLLRIRQQQYDMVASGNPVGPRTYEVNINARPEQMLNWDAPLAEQPLRDTLEKIGVRDYVASTRPGEPSFIPATGRDAYQTLAKDIGYGNIPAPHGYGNNPAGGASQMLADAGIPGIRYLDQGSRPPRGFAQTQDSIAYYKDMLSRHPDNPMLQQQLAAYQADLAKAQQGTYNYVIFDPNIIDIKRKYALPGAIGAGGMGALATQDNYQPQ